MSTIKPIVFSPSQDFNGNNGNWSSFILRVGSPEQDFRVLPSPATGVVFVPDTTGCLLSDNEAYDCASHRGVVNASYQSGFQANISTTWESLGTFEVGISTNLGFNAGAHYGRDNVGLMFQYSGGPTLPGQVVGSIINKRPFFVGFFGLSPKSFNFTNLDNPHPSYMTSLRENRQIPSISYGYTAGAHYKSPEVYGSLTLGGYDENLFESKGNTFPFYSNDERPISLTLQHLTADNTLNGSMSVLKESISVTIDFTMPYLWLPEETCDRIASIFNLKYDNGSELYLVEDDAHKDLVTSKPTFIFDFIGSLNPTQVVQIQITYDAFNLQATWPTFNTTKNYFPIRRANGSQYILGRAFMQEAYIIVDYERKNFSLHQASFPKLQEQKIVSILPKEDQGDANNIDRGDGLGKASIAMITIGSVFCLAAVVIAIALWYRRKKRLHSASQPGCIDLTNDDNAQMIEELPGKGMIKHQLMSNEVSELQESMEQNTACRHRHELQQSIPELPS